jgi:hypothetical protein
VSSHFDSVERGPGADDNTSGTRRCSRRARAGDAAAAGHIHFAFLTGEESGLLGSPRVHAPRPRERRRRGRRLNNDMIGFANDQRLDNTIRYSNAGIRDIQHAAAFLFTDLITYDTRYYRSTDAHALLRRVRRCRRRHRQLPDPRQPALPPVARRARDHQPPARRRSREDDGGDADAAGERAVTAEGW